MRASFFLLLAFSAVGVGQSLLPAGRSMPVPPDAAFENLQAFWSRGYAIYASDDTGSVTVYDTSGNQPSMVNQIRIWPDLTIQLNLVHAAASGDGSIFAVSGAAFASVGTSTSFLALFGRSGPVKLIQLPNTGLFRVAFADDGTLWAIAREVDSTWTDLPEYNTLRHYDSTGKLLGSVLPVSTFSTKRAPMYTPSLSVTADTVGVYFDRAKTWVELGYDGAVKGRWTVPDTLAPAPRHPHPGWIYLTASDQIVRLSWTSGKQQSDFASTVEYLTKSGSSLTSAPVYVPPSAYAFYYGIQGDQLIWQKAGVLNWGAIK